MCRHPSIKQLFLAPQALELMLGTTLASATAGMPASIKQLFWRRRRWNGCLGPRQAGAAGPAARGHARLGFSVIESMICMALLVIFFSMMYLALKSTTNVWRRTSARDGAMRQLVRARAFLTRDLMNGSARPNQFATAKVGPSLGSGFDGDALTILTCHSDSTPWNINSSGASILTGEVTYSLFVPQNVNTLYSATFPGVADALGYEEACPYKWLVRRQDPVPAVVPPNPESVIPGTWTTAYLLRPASKAPTATTQVVSTLLGFRVLASGSHWQFELKACAVEDARHKLPLGTAPLGSSSYTIVQRFSVPVHN